MRQHWRVCCRCGCVTREIDEPGVFINGSLNADWRSHGAGRRDGRRRGAIGVGVDCYRGAAPSTPRRNDPSRAGRRTTTTKKNLKKRSDEPNLLSRWPHKKEKKTASHFPDVGRRFDARIGARLLVVLVFFFVSSSSSKTFNIGSAILANSLRHLFFRRF